MTEPTDAEIFDAADDFRSQYKHGGTTFDEFDALGFARAVLQRWGQPSGAGEPVAWLHPANSSCVTTDPTAYARGIPLCKASQPTQAQAGAVPLTDEQIRAMCKEPWVFETVKQWVRITERHHGIKGGQP